MRLLPLDSPSKVFKLLRLSFFLFFLAESSLAQTERFEQISNHEASSERVIVRYKSDLHDQGVNALANRMGALRVTEVRAFREIPSLAVL